MSEVQIPLRLSTGILRTAAAIVPAMAADPDCAIFGTVTRATVLRVAALRGVERLEKAIEAGAPWYLEPWVLMTPFEWQKAESAMGRTSLRLPLFLVDRLDAILPAMRETTPPALSINRASTARIAIWWGIGLEYRRYRDTGMLRQCGANPDPDEVY